MKTTQIIKSITITSMLIVFGSKVSIQEHKESLTVNVSGLGSRKFEQFCDTNLVKCQQISTNVFTIKF